MTNAQEAKPGDGAKNPVVKAVAQLITASEKRTATQFEKLRGELDKVKEKNSTLGKQMDDMKKQAGDLADYKEKTITLIEKAKTLTEKAETNISLATSIVEGNKSGAIQASATAGEQQKHVVSEELGAKDEKEQTVDPLDAVRQQKWAAKLNKAANKEKQPGKMATLKGFKHYIDERLDAFAVGHAPRYNLYKGLGILAGAIAVITPIFSGASALFNGENVLKALGSGYGSLATTIFGIAKAAVSSLYSTVAATAIGYCAVRVAKTMKREHAIYKEMQDKLSADAQKKGTS
ncbi:MAG TPA: hypothetical protein PLO51_01060 [Candidatus Micrarchaeota archaeon]|nr:hypothetical protein [Candidatus Micrarchaeota archaeon]